MPKVVCMYLHYQFLLPIGYSSDKPESYLFISSVLVDVCIDCK